MNPPAKLSETLNDTLAVFQRGELLSAEEVRKRLPDEVLTTAISNRLSRLHAFGVLKRKRVSRELKYYREEVPAPKTARRRKVRTR